MQKRNIQNHRNVNEEITKYLIQQMIKENKSLVIVKKKERYSILLKNSNGEKQLLSITEEFYFL